MNAKDELLEFLREIYHDGPEISFVKCAVIVRGDEYNHFPDKKAAILNVNHTVNDIENFLNLLDFEYDDGYGTQELFGVIWFIDDTWGSRHEYDGKEWWIHNKMPEIPNDLL